MAIYSTLLGVLEAHSEHKGSSCDRMIMDYTHNEYCDILLTLSTYTRWAGTVAREHVLRYPGQHHSEANAFGQLEQCLCETGGVTPMAQMNAARPWAVQTPAN
jgi:hypothetical protein